MLPPNSQQWKRLYPLLEQKDQGRAHSTRNLITIMAKKDQRVVVNIKVKKREERISSILLRHHIPQEDMHIRTISN